MHLDRARELIRPRQDTSGSGTEPAWLGPGLFALLLGAIVAATFPQVLAGMTTFVARDFGDFSYPVAWYHHECFWHGELPFWNPYSYCGIPFVAQWNTMCLYPPTLIYLLLPMPWSLNFFCLLHLWFAGVGMYFLAHRWTGNRLAASVAGLEFAFNGLSLNFLMWPSHIATLSWMPWVILAVERGWKEGGREQIIAALAGTMQLLAGGPETVLFTWLFLVGLWVLELKGGAADTKAVGAVGRKVMVLRFALVPVLAFALATAQMLPFLDLVSHSQREAGFGDATGSMPGSGWANFLVPMAFGRIFPENFFLQDSQQWTSSYYLGVGTLLLALLALWTGRDRRRWLLAGAGAAALICALGNNTFVYPALQRLLPPLTLMTYPVKFVIVIVFVTPLLAAFGIVEVQRAGRETAGIALHRAMVTGGLLLGLIGLILFWAWRSPAPGEDFAVTLRSGLSRAGFLAATLVVLLLLQRAVNAPGRAAVCLGLVALLWFDVRTHEPPQNPTVSPSVFAAGQALVELALQPSPTLGQSRAMVSPAAKKRLSLLHSKDVETGYIARRLGFFCNCNLLDNVPKVDGFFSLSPADFDALYYARYYAPNREFPRLMDFLSVSQITAPEQLTEWTPRTTWLPMVTAGQKPLFLDQAATARRLAEPDFDGSKVVLLPPDAEPLMAATRQTDAQITSLNFGRQRVEFDVVAAEPSLAVIAQTYYHWWRACVDDEPAPLLQANYAFQAVPLPAGRHHVRLVYQDDAFRLGAIISIVAVVGCAIAWRRLDRKH